MCSSMLEEIYSLPQIYNKEGIIIFKRNNQIIKFFDDFEDIDILYNKKAKLEILSKCSLYNFSQCRDINFNNPKASYYVADYIEGEQVLKMKGYKHYIDEKIAILYKVLDAIIEAHEKRMLVNDIHGRNFFYDKNTNLLKGIDIDNLKVGNYHADELPDFINRFTDDVSLLDIQTDKIAFGLMILDTLCPKDIDLDNFSIEELLNFIDLLKISNFVKEEFYCLFTKSSANIEDILSGLSQQQGKVLCYA